MSQILRSELLLIHYSLVPQYLYNILCWVKWMNDLSVGWKIWKTLLFKMFSVRVFLHENKTAQRLFLTLSVYPWKEDKRWRISGNLLLGGQIRIQWENESTWSTGSPVKFDWNIPSVLDTKCDVLQPLWRRAYFSLFYISFLLSNKQGVNSVLFIHCFFSPSVSIFQLRTHNLLSQSELSG